LVIVAIATSTVLSGCAFETTVDESIGIPRRVSEIQFWNGGGLIFEASGGVGVLTKIDTNEKILGKSISFYRYEVTVNGQKTIIVDSEALAIVYKE
jgi:hypothetical protein